MKRNRVLFVISFLLVSYTGVEEAFAFHLQEVLDKTEEGAVITLPSGEYEGPFTITKPITLEGSMEAILYNKVGESTLTLNSDGVHITGVMIVQEKEKRDAAALLIRGDENMISNVIIETSGMGIVLEQANQNKIHHVKIKGPFQNSAFHGSMLSRQGNGIDLFRSNANLIDEVTLQYVQDGVYIETGEGNIVKNVSVSDSRYGFHLMFTRNTSLLNNVSERNITGAMIMETEGTRMEKNQFRKQSNHVHSQGIMLFDVHDAIVMNNVIAENLFGIYIESSSNNLVMDNQVLSNYIGMEVLRSEGNEIKNNDFIHNVISARATKSKDNTILYNYWDEHIGFDATGDGISQIAYYSDPIFSSIVASKPAYQLFADAPSILFLQMLLDINREEVLADKAPRMAENKSIAVQQDRDTLELVLYMLAIWISLLIIYLGVRKK